MTTKPMAMMPRKIVQPERCWIAHSELGNRAAIEVKMSSDIPLPTPLSVMSSPSHMIRPVPAVMVRTMMRIVTTESFERIVVHEGLLNSVAGFCANVTSVELWRTARPMVR